MAYAPDLVLERPPRWIGALAVVLVHVLLVVWLGSSVRRVVPKPQADPARTLITIQLQPLSRMAQLPAAAPEHRRADAQGRRASETPTRGGFASSLSQLSPPTARRAASPDRDTASALPRASTKRAVAADTAPAPSVIDAVPLTTGVPALAASSTLPPMAAASEAPGAARPAASGPSGRELMQGDATRLAIRQATRGTPLLSERADQASQAPARLDTTARLGREIKEAGAGDCLKGEYAGGGMGLLSAPFLLLAQARGKCAK